MYTVVFLLNYLMSENFKLFQSRRIKQENLTTAEKVVEEAFEKDFFDSISNSLGYLWRIFPKNG